MAKGIDISIAADTRSAMSAINRGLIDPLEDVSELLETVGDDGKDATDDLEKGMRDAQRRTDDAADEVRKLRDELNKAGRQGKNTGDDIRDGFRRAEDGAEEFRDEANSTAREAAASFDGSAESIADAFQEIAANAFAGFGPAGAAAGIAAAAGIGLANAGFESVHEAEEKAAELASEWADRFVESGQRVATAAQQSAAVIDISTDSEKYKEATENAELWGTTVSDAMLAMAGNAGAIQVVEDALDRKRVATEKDAQAAQEAAEQNGSALAALTPQQIELQKAEEAWRRHTDAMTNGATQADAASDSLLAIVEDAEQAAVSVDELGNRVIELPDGAEIFIDAKTGKASADVSRFKGDFDKKVDQMNGRDVLLDVRAQLGQAQRDVNGFLASNDGRSFKLNARVVTSGGTEWD
ncbi:hypothetical protein AB0P00_17640 [Microbacterium sp. NPDC077057]|uniref:hypothetical protein n=1 Tax=Microbacterium sp. NPDC077057 TaxID=3154763 RepID=UPI0034426D04